MKKLSLITLLIYSFGYTTSVFAQCLEVGGQIKVNGRDIIVTDKMPVGTLLDTFTTDFIKTYQCPNKKNLVTGGKVYGELAKNIGRMRVYKTNIDGIGYTLGFQSMCGNVYFPTDYWTYTCSYAGSWNTITHEFVVRIYKIGQTGNGNVSTRRVGASLLYYNDTKRWAKENPVFLNSFKVTTIGDDSGGQGNNNGGGQGNNSGGQGSNNGGGQGNNNWDRGSQGHNNGGGQGGNQNNNAVWPNGNVNNNSIWPNGNVNNNINNNLHRNDHN